ncbi:MAG: energy transducer TonB [Casimicrobiaceae bacterium]|nr:energy transducer TonB [Casimicrobiaceae bacterium]
MNRAGVDRIEGTVLVTLNPDGTFTNVRVKEVSPPGMRNVVQRTFAGPLTSSACRTEKSDVASEVEIPFVMRLE